MLDGGGSINGYDDDIKNTNTKKRMNNDKYRQGRRCDWETTHLC